MMSSCEAIRESTTTAAAVVPTTPTHNPIDDVARASFETRALSSSVSAPPKTSRRVKKIKQHSLTSTAAGIKADPGSHPLLAKRLTKLEILNDVIEAIEENNIKKLDKLCHTHPEVLHFCGINGESLFTLTIRCFEENGWSAEILEILVKHDPKLKATLQEYIFKYVSARRLLSHNLHLFIVRVIKVNLLDPYLLMCRLVGKPIYNSFSKELLDIYKWDTIQLLKDSVGNNPNLNVVMYINAYAASLNMPLEEVKHVIAALLVNPYSLTCEEVRKYRGGCYTDCLTELLDLYKWDKTQLLKDSLTDCEVDKKWPAWVYAEVLDMPEAEVESVLRSLRPQSVAQKICTLM